MDPQWACYFYVSADNSLRDVAKKTISEIGTADVKNVNAVLQADLPDKRLLRYVLEPGRLQLLREIPATSRNINSGTERSLTNFLVASRRLRPGHSAALFFNGHGFGVMDFKFETLPGLPLNGNGNGNGNGAQRPPSAFGIGGDDTSRDFLDNDELEGSLRKLLRHHPKYDIIGCDACLMGAVEVAHQLRSFGTYFVASQDNEPAEGWPYADVMKAFVNGADGATVATSIVDAYDKAFSDPTATLAAVALDLMDGLAAALDHLGGALLPFVESQLKAIALAREKTRTFASFDSIDLCGFATNVREQLLARMPDDANRRAILAAADAVISTVTHAVIKTVKDPQACGLSVYIPNGPVIAAYHDLPLSKAAPRWHDFVDAYGKADRSTL